ncbi:MAG TPA: GNAT family N-acetyltransferase [Noviherbaspirillum sp.]|uniref:GNAT family N-acetyltransferase n=1 Tax=Noviherbaspirillum sp. TaxID=1926288 RepID=UPI002B475328|nr:GNAT family N-acetyltransferase [Noviherbaspirillum sp.]HJV85536.1 GNAT family N-acetyltransferase [Noviherbaspirillum sp.]
MPTAESHSSKPPSPGTSRNLLVREAGIKDAALIADLTRAAWAGKVAMTSSGHREAAERVLQHLQHGGAFILMKGEEAIGSVRWVPVESEPQVWEIMRMGVLPAWRGERLSEFLLEAVIHRAQAADVIELRLGVRADQPRLLDLYAALGFDLAPELEYTHANPEEPAPTVMRRLLRY